VLGTAVGRTQTQETSNAASESDREFDFDVDDQIATAEQRSFDVEGMDPSISEGFYQVDISSVDPDVAADDWTLSVTGAVEEEFELTYEDIREMDHEHRFSTLRCVGESLNGHKMDTALWTGVPAAPIIERASPTGSCNCVMLRADGDDFYEEFPLDALRPGMLAYGMNGGGLPRGHGAPVRAIVPGHWGEVNVKWLTEIEFLETEQDGYWEQRGWHGTGPVKTVAKIHGQELREDSLVVGGHAYAGTRGISRVEVSIDGGPWQEAEVTERLPGVTAPAADVGGGNPDYAADAWRLWRYSMPAPDSGVQVRARAYERDGTRQPRESTGSFPSGPSGWVTKTVDPGGL
jgi:DMSO/TMAO reductase YedYZ molybdopterin-dependent catalytic subunit